MPINLQVLRDSLTQINADKTKKEMYSSKVYAVLSVIATNMGLQIARLAKIGAQAKITEARQTDIDVIFSTAPDKARKDLYPLLETKLKSFLGATVKITKTPERVHIEYPQVKFSLDLVLMNQKDFDAAGYSGLRDIKQIDTTPLDAIKVIKYALDKQGILNNIPSGIIEKTAFNQPAKDFVVAVEKSIFQLGSEIKKAGRTPEDIVKVFR